MQADIELRVTGDALVLVRADSPRYPFWVTHLGFVLDTPRKTFRHASRMQSALKVRDNPLGRYLSYLTTWKRWPVAGVILLEPQPHGPPRRSAHP